MVSFLGTVTWERIPALYGRNTVLFNDRKVRISVPDITTRIRSRILRPGYIIFLERETAFISSSIINC